MKTEEKKKVEKKEVKIRITLITLILIVVFSILVLLIVALLFSNSEVKAKLFSREMLLTKANMQIKSITDELDELKARTQSKDDKDESDLETETTENKAEDPFVKYSKYIDLDKIENVVLDNYEGKLDYKIINSDVEPFFIYDYLPAPTTVGTYYLADMLSNDKNIEKFCRTYYSFNRDGYRKEIKGDVIGYEEGPGVSLASVGPFPIGTIASTTDYNMVPRTLKYADYNSMSDGLSKAIDELDKVPNKTARSPHVYKVNLNGDQDYYLVFNDTFIKFAYNENEDGTLGIKTSLMLYDAEGKYVDTLISFCKIESYFPEWTFDDTDIFVADVDNDGKMEILVDLQVWEGVGVGIYKVEDGKVIGDTNAYIFGTT